MFARLTQQRVSAVPWRCGVATVGETASARAGMSLARSLATQLSHHANRKHGIRHMPNAVPKAYSCDISETGDATNVNGWELIGRSHLNTLVIGPPAITRQLVERLGPHLPSPVVRVHAGELIAFPPRDGPVGTVILDDVDELGLIDQRRLLDWLDNVSARPRVIATAPRPIIAKVAEGEFLPVLYYRLNLFYVDVADIGAGTGPSPLM